MPEPIPDFTPVNLLTGCLGSGKTTLLRRLLGEPELADCAVLINEFGEVGLDHHLLERIDETMVLLQSGCVCCTIRGELSDSIRNLHERRARSEIPVFRRLVIESTGLADPYPILSTVHSDPVLRHHFRLGNVIATIDAVNAAEQLAQQEECAKQIAVADRLVLTKTDLAAADEIDRLVARVKSINPSAALWRAAERPPRAEDLFARGDHEFAAQFLPSPSNGHDHGDDHSHSDIHAFALIFDRPLDWTRFGIWLTMLLNRHGRDVLRVKGILDVEGCETPVAIHGVQHLVHPPVHLRAWPESTRQSRLVFIVKGLARSRIERSMQAFGLFEDLQSVK